MICDVISRGDLEAYVFGELAASGARRVESHLFGCAECAAEMRRLREERRLFRSRAEEETPPVPSFESILARAEAVRPEMASSKQSVSRAPRSAAGGSGRSGRGVAVTSALLSIAAVLAGLWMHGATPSPEQSLPAADTDSPPIVRDPTCGALPDDEDDKKLAVSLEPTASVDLSLAPRRTDPPRANPETSECPESCAPDPSTTSACGDPIAWCAAPDP